MSLLIIIDCNVVLIGSFRFKIWVCLSSVFLWTMPVKGWMTETSWYLQTSSVQDSSFFVRCHLLSLSFSYCLLSIEHKRWIFEEYPSRFLYNESEWRLVPLSFNFSLFHTQSYHMSPKGLEMQHELYEPFLWYFYDAFASVLKLESSSSHSLSL